MKIERFAMKDIDTAEIERRFLAQQEYLGSDKPVNRSEPLVSINLATYQHAAFIGRCLDSIVEQQTTFPFEVIIGEDQSTDGTRELCIDYANRHPDKIRLFLRSREQSHYVRGDARVRLNGTWCRQSARGKYVAMCEGDDYWLSPAKLQKQVDLLEAHPEFALCFHNVLIVDEGSSDVPRAAYRYNMKLRYDLWDLFPTNFIHTPSAMYRRDALSFPMPPWYYGMPMFDWPTYLLVARNGAIAYLPETLAAYRRHAGGIWSQMTRTAWLDRNARAASIVLSEFDFNRSGGAEAMAALRRHLMRLLLEQGQRATAAVHARKLLTHGARRLLREMRRLARGYLAEAAESAAALRPRKVPPKYPGPSGPGA